MKASGMTSSLGVCGVYRTNPHLGQRGQFGDCAPVAKVGHWRRWGPSVAGSSGEAASASGRMTMTFRSSGRRGELLAGNIGTLAIVLPAVAQQQPAPAPAPAASAPAPLPPGSPLIGRPNTESPMKPAPGAPPPLPAAP